MIFVAVLMAIAVDGSKPMRTSDHRGHTESPAAEEQESSDDFYAISRIRFKNCQGWSVSVNRHRIPYRKVFTVYRYCCMDKALKAARAWRDEIVQTVLPMTLVECSNQARVNNTSGYPGVYRMKLIKKDKAGNERCHVSWEARSPTGMKPARKKSYAVLKYGDAKAYGLAVEARKAFVAQLEGYLLNRVTDHLREKLFANEDPITNG